MIESTIGHFLTSKRPQGFEYEKCPARDRKRSRNESDPIIYMSFWLTRKPKYRVYSSGTKYTISRTTPLSLCLLFRKCTRRMTSKILLKNTNEKLASMLIDRLKLIITVYFHV
ncbi:MAG: hypothetical protein ACJAUF_000944 [Bacteroidia bacterium]|jgi:hypothetical protein|tara:strand:- start:101 stop:439 length:339 start_codon:yes stop_codon:yes gene_type:complete